jgi:Na+-translocating ferredoxin:NAD+ oxidoreductase subunit B
MDLFLPPIVLGLLGLVLGLLIFVFGYYFSVKEDSRIDDIEKMLPRYNCGACGYGGCRDMANGLLAHKAVVSQCKPIKPEAKAVLMKHLDELFKAEAEALKH